MATATISIGDVMWTQVRAAAGENLSAWITTAFRDRLLTDAARAAREWEREHPAEAAAARTEEDTVSVLEGEAEREIMDHAEHTARIRAGDGTEPTTADYLAAYGHVRALLERAEQQLRDQLAGEQ